MKEKLYRLVCWFKNMLAYSDIGAVPGSANIQVNDLDIKITRNG
jgi:hypothetical protein